jgi:hypothetical protein
MTSLLNSGVRAVSDGEVDQVAGGLWWVPFVVVGIHLGMAIGFGTEGGSVDTPSEPGDYPVGQKNTA